MSHPINETRKEEFINLCDKSVQASIRKLLDNTRYVSFEEFKQRIDDNIPELLTLCKGHETVYFYVMGYPDSKKDNPYNFELLSEKSNYWVFQILEDLIQQEKYQDKYKFKFEMLHSGTKEVPENAFIIMLDDCMYSGMQMDTQLSNLLTEIKLKCSIHIFVPFATKQAITRVKYVLKLYRFHTKPVTLTFSKNTVILDTVDDLLTDEDIAQIESIYDHTFTVLGRTLVYFDHKLADDTSTVTLIYSGLIANSANRTILSEIWSLRSKKLDSDQYTSERDKLIQQLQYHEFIDNCIGVRNFDQECPLCPYPPYKKLKKHKKPKLSIQQ